MTAPLAHASHWLTDLLYVAPLAVALGLLFVQSRRDRRSDEADDSSKTADVPPAT